MNGFNKLTRYGLGIAQNILRLFVAGAGIYEIHQGILMWHWDEWSRILGEGPDPACWMNDLIAHGYKMGGATLCRGITIYFPWLKLYENHLLFVLSVYSVAAGLLFLAGWIWHMRLGHRVRHDQRAVQQQMAHGDARLATEAEATAVASDSGGRRRSAVHEQEF